MLEPQQPMDERIMSKPLTQAEIITVLAEETGLTKTAVRQFLQQLAELAYRETKNGFTLPGLCKFKIVRRKQTRRYNPFTKSYLTLAEHDTLRIMPLKKARDTITPAPDNLIIREEPAKEDTQPASASSPFKTPAPPVSHAAARNSETGGIIFSCPHCNNTIMAKFEDRGQQAECPVCNGHMLVPDGNTTPMEAQTATDHSVKSVSNFVTFACNVCKQEIEAPIEMIGLEATCPACGSQLNVPGQDTPSEGQADAATPETAQEAVDRSSMTIRMDLSDLT